MLEVEDDFDVVGEAGSVEEALQRVAATRPDVAAWMCGSPTAAASSCAVSCARHTPTSCA